MAETIAAVLERLSDQPDRFEQLWRMLGNSRQRSAYDKHIDERARRGSGHYSIAMQRRTKFYAELVRREGERLESENQLDAMREFDNNLSSILASIHFSLEHNLGLPPLHFVNSLYMYLDRSGRWDEALSLLEHIIAGARRAEQSEYLCEALLACAGSLFGVARYSEAINAAAEALNIARTLENERDEASAMNLIANISCQQGDILGAIEWHEKALAIRRRIGHAVAASLCNYASVCLMGLFLEKAMELFEECMELNRRSNDRQLMSITLNNMGNLAQTLGRLTDAQSNYEQCLAICTELGDRHGCAMATGNLGRNALYSGDYINAELQLRKALALFQGINDIQGVADCWINLALVALCRGDTRDANGILKEMRAIAQSTGEPSHVNFVDAAQAHVAIHEGNMTEAANLLRHVLLKEIELRNSDPDKLLYSAMIKLLSRTGQLTQAAVLTLGIASQFRRKGMFIGPVTKECIAESTDKLEQEIPPEQLAELQIQAEAMSLDELRDYALSALETLQHKLDAGESGGDQAAALPAEG